MKHLLIAAIAALTLLATEQKASAWTKFGVGIGAHLGYEAADNNLLFGLFRNGPHPSAAGHGQGGYHDHKHGPNYGPGYYGPGYGQPYWHGQGGPGAPGLNTPDFSAPAVGTPVPGIAGPQSVPMPYATGSLGTPVVPSQVTNATFWSPAN
jgi:hypothetical protein